MCTTISRITPKKLMRKLNYYIWSPNFDSHSGGIIALNKLAHNLRAIGEKSFLVSDTSDPSLNIIKCKVDQQIISDPNTVMIYPEIIIGNPFVTKNVVRWLLNTPGVIGGDGNYGYRDLIFKYNEYFKYEGNKPVSGILTAYDFDLNFWKDQNQPRLGQCFLVKKGYNRVLNAHNPNAIRIDGWEHQGGNQHLLDIFNRFESFVCYDTCTFVTVFAALCGCTSIVIPEEGVTIEEWYDKIPIFKYGIAYGFDDIERAKNTRGDLINYLKSTEDSSIKELKEFVKLCENHFK